jgi:hypothetical protein
MSHVSIFPQLISHPLSSKKEKIKREKKKIKKKGERKRENGGKIRQRQKKKENRKKKKKEGRKRLVTRRPTWYILSRLGIYVVKPGLKVNKDPCRSIQDKTKWMHGLGPQFGNGT